jgi:hypothetical protein
VLRLLVPAFARRATTLRPTDDDRRRRPTTDDPGGASCTKKSFKSRGKAFLYVGVSRDSYNAMLKLRESQAEATALASKDARVKVGAQGWVTATFGLSKPLPREVFERWIDESYRRLLVDKKLVATLPERGALGARKNSAPKKKKDDERRLLEAMAKSDAQIEHGKVVPAEQALAGLRARRRA